MTAPTTTVGKSAVRKRDWNVDLGFTEDGEPKEPRRGTLHDVCGRCYPAGYTGPTVTRCGRVLDNGLPVGDFRPIEGYRQCQPCALAVHRNVPCPNRDCPARPWWRRMLRR